MFSFQEVFLAIPYARTCENRLSRKNKLSKVGNGIVHEKQASVAIVLSTKDLENIDEEELKLFHGKIFDIQSKKNRRKVSMGRS